MRTISSREFNQDVGGAKRAASAEPVFVTDRGKPTHVLMSFEAFLQITGETSSIADLLAVSDAAEVDVATAGSADWDRVGDIG
jgi:hypothetical protein